MIREAIAKINQCLEYFPIVVILGARQCGKTTLSQVLRPDWHYIDLDNPADFARFQTQDPVFYLNHYRENLIIDEAQAYPAVFDILRGVVDRDRNQKGRFILTGSSSPDLLKHATNTLAGRVAIIDLGTLTPSEIFSKPIPPLYRYFQDENNLDYLLNLKPVLTIAEVHQAWLRGGYPEPVLKKDPHFFDFWMAEYQKTYLFRDVAKLFPRLNHQAYQRFLSILARLSGTILNKSDLARSIEVSEPSIRDYLQIAEGTFLWRAIPSFDRHPLRQVVKMPKGHFRDSGLLNYLLRIRTLEDLFNHPQQGHLFESFVIESMIKHLEASFMTNWQAHYYRTRNGAEVDLILEGYFGMLPIEIKFGKTIMPKQLFSLQAFVKENNLPLGMLINQGDEVRMLTDQIIQVPAQFLL
ncbi:MAG: AAA family ATPase [Gammaproteobacteria bacterium]|nr:AAA family ATPase [Gammaproteobacteria bacterium]